MRFTLLKFTDFCRRGPLLPPGLLLAAVMCLPIEVTAAEEITGAEATTAITFDAKDMTVFKHRFCFCCKDWIEHLQHSGMSPTIVNRGDMGSIKSRWAIPEGFGSCHTAVWRDRYVFEGHIPARLIRRFLSDPPEGAIGLSVPGMPESSPGMYEGGEFEPYNVYVLLLGGDYQLYARVTELEEEQGGTAATP
ncbi:DUF411 domain-containing protein [Microbulbifer guangxiensis]|uniref:DUF411 domain-containing protein n=1 Tax=Microbulbifer guangxiensis TaxID=2904249 RepID=UPI001F374081|nr:DUF411 domain-containing protein [Microbulbifer guangxiensis]